MHVHLFKLNSIQFTLEKGGVNFNSNKSVSSNLNKSTFDSNLKFNSKAVSFKLSSNSRQIKPSRSQLGINAILKAV
jgi:hypothetical protein